MKKILLLGSGELGKEFTIAAQRLGQHVIACDNYAGAPAMQVADEYEVFSMLDGKALDATVAKHRPNVIICEIEAIRTERLYDYEQQGMQQTKLVTLALSSHLCHLAEKDSLLSKMQMKFPQRLNMAWPEVAEMLKNSL